MVTEERLCSLTANTGSLFVSYAYLHVCAGTKELFLQSSSSTEVLLSAMWEGRLPPIGPELLAAAFLPLLGGGWRGIICQHAGSHCLWAGTNAASIRQLGSGVCTYSMCGWISHVTVYVCFCSSKVICVFDRSAVHCYSVELGNTKSVIITLM